ncbi:MAG: hypothetical protein WDN28_29485 [Chthoniobacter sp.]
MIRFQNDVLPPGSVFQWSRWSARDKKCRQLFAFSLGAFDEIVVNEFQRQWHSQGRVYLNGTAYTSGKLRSLRKVEQEESSRRAGLCDDAREIQESLNSLAPNLFTRAISENFDAASSVASRIPKANVLMEQRRLLRQIHSQPQPFYGASESERTVRLWKSGAIPNLKGDVRRALTRGWEDADLRCSQLAICASLWGLPELQDFLTRGTSFWTYVFDEMDVPTTQRGPVKRAIKDGLYAICYGMEEKHLARPFIGERHWRCTSRNTFHRRAGRTGER